MKKVLSIILVVASLVSLSVLSIYAAGEDGYTQDSILVDSYGTVLSVKVFVSEDEEVLIPVDILSLCGGLCKNSDNSDYIYYDGVQGIGYEKEIRISKNGESGKINVNITPYESVTISSAKFSDSHMYENELYLSLPELLPFLDAKVEIKDDGILHIYPNPVSIFNAIAYDDLDADIFSIDNVFAGLFTGATGYIFDTIINLRFDRLDKITDSGEITDYNKLFEMLLTCNETYLSAFNNEKTPSDIILEEISNSMNDYNDFVESVDDSFKVTKALFYIIDSDLFKNSKEFAKDMEGFDAFGEAVDGVFRVVQYADALNKQVDDHRNMLNAVYGGKYYTDSAKCIAANETALKYGQDTAGVIVSTTSSYLRDAIVKAGNGAISKSELLLPYKITFEFLKFYRPEMKEVLEDTSNMFYLDTIVSDSATVAKELMRSKSYDAKTLEDLRLSMIMALLTSKYAYEIYYDGFLDYEKNGGDVAWKYYKINEWLTMLYIAKDSVECYTPEYYSATKNELSSSIKYLKLGENIDPDTPNVKPQNGAYTRDGDYIYFGEYPQTIKAENVTITSTSDSRGYYLGSDGFYYAKIVALPHGDGDFPISFSTGTTVSYGSLYYFKVEPIRWRILSENGQTALILCDSIIANRRYDDLSNNYAESEIRQWLNTTFYQTAFSELQREIISITTVDNSAESAGYAESPYACENTEDKVFLLSRSEVTNSEYGFSSDKYESDNARGMQTSDYSRATGAFTVHWSDSNYYGNGRWWLRSPAYGDSYLVLDVFYDQSNAGAYTVDGGHVGIVPAMWIDLNP